MTKESFRVLLVDDESVILTVMQEVLEEAGYSCRTASSGAVALQRFQEEPASLVISDIRMPGVSGVQLADALCAKQSDTLIVLITGYAEPDVLSQALKQSPFGFLEKPFLPNQLVALVERAEKYWSDRFDSQEQGRLLEQQVSEKTKELEFKTDRLIAEKDLLHGIVNDANFGLMAFDTSGQTHLLNRLACELLAIDESLYAQYHGFPYRDLLPKECYDALTPLLDETRKTNGLETAEFMNPLNDRHLSVIGYPIIRHSRVTALVLVVHDVTEKETLQRRLLQSQKLASIGELAAGVAHEINNPLGFVMSNCNSLSGYVDTLKDYISLLEGACSSTAAPNTPIGTQVTQAKSEMDIPFIQEDMSELLAETLDGLDRVSKIVRDLKSFARADNDTAERCEINDLIDNALNLARNEIKYNLEIVKNFAPLPAVSGFPSQLVQVFTNMFVNASHAAKAKGTLTITTSATDRVIRISIADNGEGISEKDLSRIFDPFFTTKPPGKGTGMGLSISYGIIERHGGRILASSEVGVGTEFTIELPVKRPAECGQSAEPVAVTQGGLS